ncbi:MAG: hypothetical protein NTX50_06030 [Candidatus Sumerlaeota bacterium]|nr:hypothetical protein [Candidatus Sumerlaeota bacterium]
MKSLPAEIGSQEAVFNSLLRVLDYSRGAFSLSIAVCPPREQARLVERLKLEWQGLCVLDLPAFTPNILRYAREQCPEPEGPLMVTGLDRLVAPLENGDFQTLRVLNASREKWPDIYKCPVVFWASSYVVRALALRAPDFWRWISHHFYFDESGAEGKSEGAGGSEPEMAKREILDVEEDFDIPEADRPARIKELEEYLKEAGENPPPALQPHILRWRLELSYHYTNDCDWDRAESLANRALELALKMNFPEAEVRALDGLARFLIQCTRWDEAQSQLLKALPIAKTCASPRFLARIYFRLHVVALLKSDWDTARDWGKQIAYLRDSYSQDPAIALMDATGAVNASYCYGLAKRFADLERWAERLTLVRDAFSEDCGIALREAISAVNAIWGYGLAQRFEDLERWGGRLALVRGAFQEDRKIALAEVNGAVNAIYLYGLAQRFKDLERWRTRLATVSEAFPQDQEIMGIASKHLKKS